MYQAGYGSPGTSISHSAGGMSSVITTWVAPSCLARAALRSNASRPEAAPHKGATAIHAKTANQVFIGKQLDHIITRPMRPVLSAEMQKPAGAGGILRCMTVTDNLFGTTQLSSTRAEAIKKTYMLLGLSVAGALCGGYVGAQSDTLANLFTGWIGWILAMVLLNFIPRVAIAARHNPVLGVIALLADGFVSGLVLAPILRIASLYASGTIQIAMLMTLIVFGAVTLFVMSSKRTFSAPRGLMLGIAISTTLPPEIIARLLADVDVIARRMPRRIAAELALPAQFSGIGYLRTITSACRDALRTLVRLLREGRGLRPADLPNLRSIGAA